MEMTKINGIGEPQIDNMQNGTAAPTPEIAQNTSVVDPVIQETPLEQAKTDRRHTLMYIAGGIWKDSNGAFWCRDEHDNCITSETISEEEYQSREDIKYMVGYGSIKDTISE